MRTPNLRIERYRVAPPFDPRNTAAGTNNGWFKVPGPCGGTMTVIASDGGGWDHVSASLPNRCPNWKEMAFLKELFFDDEECVLQYHPPKSRYVNVHPYCLHLWRKQGVTVELPPTEMLA